MKNSIVFPALLTFRHAPSTQVPIKSINGSCFFLHLLYYKTKAYADDLFQWPGRWNPLLQNQVFYENSIQIVRKLAGEVTL